MVGPIRQADDVEATLGALLHLVGGDAPPAVEHGQLDVFERGRAGEEIEALEDEAEFLVAEVGELVAVQLGDVHAIEQVASRRRPIQAPQCIHEGGFARAARAHDGHELALVEFERDPADGVYFYLAGIVDPMDVLEFNDGGHARERDGRTRNDAGR